MSTQVWRRDERDSPFLQQIPRNYEFTRFPYIHHITIFIHKLGSHMRLNFSDRLDSLDDGIRWGGLEGYWTGFRFNASAISQDI